MSEPIAMTVGALRQVSNSVGVRRDEGPFLNAAADEGIQGPHRALAGGVKLRRAGGTMTYLDKLIALHRAGLVPNNSVTEVFVRHDNWCALLNHVGPCNCDPAVELRPIKGGGQE